MTFKYTVGILAKNDMAHASDSFIESVRGLGSLVKREDTLILASFSGGSQYFKESVLKSDGALLSLSPACSKEEHELVFRLQILPDEKILYTGLGRQLTIATVVRSADIVVALDEGAFEEAKLLSTEQDTQKLYLLNEKTKDMLMGLF